MSPEPGHHTADNFMLTREGRPPLAALLERLQANYAFFKGMSDKDLVRFLRMCSRQSFKAGEFVFREGEVGDCFYLIVFGGVLITREGRELAHIGQGQCFGEMAVLEGTVRNASAQASDDTLVFCVEREIIEDVFPSLGFKVAAGLAKDLSAKLRETDERLRKLEAGAG